MRIFKEPNLSNDWKCPICHKADKKEVVLIGIAGTESNGNVEAEQIHLDCITLVYDKQHEVLFQHL